jgi:hypothetical protein
VIPLPHPRDFVAFTQTLTLSLRPSSHTAQASQNILSLYGKRIPYNLCRNLEWQICAAKGMLPGQGGFGIRFATAPKRLHTRGNKPFGQCGGWTPTGECNGGYATDDIYFLEICLLNQLCTNNHELFELEVGQFFVCQLDEARFWELKEILLTPPTSGDERCPANYHYCQVSEVDSNPAAHQNYAPGVYLSIPVLYAYVEAPFRAGK